MGQTREREEAGTGGGSFLDEELCEKGTYVTGTWCVEESRWEHQLVAVHKRAWGSGLELAGLK